MLQPTDIYNGDVTVKMTEKHVYYVKYKEYEKWQISQGVTGALEELYDQRGLIDWAAGQAASKVTKLIAGADNEKWLDKAFLEIWKGNSPDVKDITVPLALTGLDLVSLYQEGVGAHKQKAQYGKDVGTQVHDAIDKYHRTGEKTIDPSGVAEQDQVAADSFSAYVKWFESSGLGILETERVVHSKSYNYCGTLDRIYVDQDGGLIIGDFKTSNVSRSNPLGVRAQYWSQVGAYALAYSEETGKKFVDAIIVNSPKNGRIQVVRSSNLAQPLSAEDCVRIWKTDLQAFRNHKLVNNSLRGVVSEV